MSQSLNVVYKHDDFYIINKPINVSFHSENGPGFVVKAENQLNEKFYAVHRLDKVTSGLIVLARTSAAAAKLTRLFSERNIEKYYLALSENKPKKKQGWIKGDMAKARRGAYKLLNSKVDPAITRFYSINIAPGLRAYLLKPYSGKTHQLRVAMKSISAPILGDVLYSAQTSDRVYLHAFSLKFSWQQENIEVCQWPEEGESFHLPEFYDVCKQWQSPWNLKW